MDAKITLSFNAEVIARAKQLADDLDISLSRLTEILLRKALEHGRPVSIEDLPISTWVNAVADEGASYITKPKSRSQLKKEFFEGRK
jgi:hypothetical protein